MNLKSKGAASELWIGEPPTSLQLGVILTVSIMGAIMPSLLPILLGGLLQEHRLTASLMGQTATIELLAIGVVSGMAGAWLPHRHLRQIGFLAGVLLVAANVATMFLSGAAILAVRGLSGMCCGLYLWVIVGMFVRSKIAARWIGIYTLLLGVAALALSSLFSAILMPRYGINGAFAGLAAICGFMALASWLLPAAYSPLDDTAATGGRGVRFRVRCLADARAPRTFESALDRCRSHAFARLACSRGVGAPGVVRRTELRALARAIAFAETSVVAERRFGGIEESDEAVGDRGAEQLHGDEHRDGPGRDAGEAVGEGSGHRDGGIGEARRRSEPVRTADPRADGEGHDRAASGADAPVDDEQEPDGGDDFRQP